MKYLVESKMICKIFENGLPNNRILLLEQVIEIVEFSHVTNLTVIIFFWKRKNIADSLL